MSSPQINHKDKFLYEHLSLIIQEFEEAAIKSNTRAGFMVAANSPMHAMDAVLESSSKALLMNRTKAVEHAPVSKEKSVTSSAGITVSNPTQKDSDGFLPSVPTVPSVTIDAALNAELLGGEGSIVDLTTVTFDEDMQNLTGGKNLHEMLKDCLACDLRVTFDWQLKPIDLLGPIGELVKDINLSLDNFEQHMDPFGSLKNLCEILNGIHWLCIPDLMTILMSLKLLLKKYLSFQLEINLDWTVIIGPLLKLILDAIGSLIQAIAGVLLGPLDCVLGALKSIAAMEKQLQSTVEAAEAVANRVATRAGQVSDAVNPNEEMELDEDTTFETNTLFKDVKTIPGSKGGASTSTVKVDGVDTKVLDLTAPTPPSLKAKQRRGDQEQAKWTEWSFPSGVELNNNVKLPDSLKDPRFNFAHWTTKVILAIQEAKNYILELVRKIIGSLNSLKGLVSGGLSLQLGNLGLLLFLKDMIALVILIIKLLQGRKPKDWCTELEQHPEILQEALGNIQVTSENKTLILAQGPKILGTIKTCAAETSGPQQQMLNQWITELKRGS